VEIFHGFLGEFLGYLEWLGPNRKYFSETEGPVVIFPNAQGSWKIYKKLRGLNAKWQGIMNFSDLFSNGKSGGPGPRCLNRAVRLESIMD
jgi:hypothetical protein